MYYFVKSGGDIDRICKGCCIRDMAEYGTFELRQCIEDGLIEYEKYYNEVLDEMTKKLNSLLCLDIIQLIMDTAYPNYNKVVEDKEEKVDKTQSDKMCSNNKQRNNKRKHDAILSLDGSDDDLISSPPPNKRQRLNQ